MVCTDERTRRFVNRIPPQGLYPKQEPIVLTATEEDDSPREEPIGEPIAEPIDEPSSTYMGIVFEAGTLEPAEAASVTYYIVLTDAIGAIKEEMENKPDDSESSGSGVEFSLVCDTKRCPEEALDGYERGELSEKSPDPGEEPPTNLVMTGFYTFTPAILHAGHLVQPSDRGEYEITDAVNLLLQSGRTIDAIRMDGWRVNVGYPRDRERAEERLQDERGEDERSAMVETEGSE